MKPRGLERLGALRDALLQREAEAAATRVQAEAERQRLGRAQRAFADAVGPVHALPAHGRARPTRAPPPPQPRQREADERAALREAMSDAVSIESLLLTDDGLSFRRPGVGPDVVADLRRGRWAVQAQLDLHGLRRDEAHDSLGAFVRDALRAGRRCVRVVHGKGHGSPGGEPVLKAKVQRWLAQRDEVIAFAQATRAQGGAGALLVLLQRRERAD